MVDKTGHQCYTIIIKGKENKTMTKTWEEMNKMERLAEIMFQTKEDFEVEKAEKEEKKEG